MTKKLREELEAAVKQSELQVNTHQEELVKANQRLKEMEMQMSQKTTDLLQMTQKMKDLEQMSLKLKDLEAQKDHESQAKARPIQLEHSMKIQVTYIVF